jgi:hypothetical protein
MRVNSARVQSMLEKAGECDRNAAGARLPEAQSAFRALAEQWRRLAIEVEQSERGGGDSVSV